jgi:hypothetical protein
MTTVSGSLVTVMSSMPMKASVPTASVVMILISTCAWLLAAAGRVTVSIVSPPLLALATEAMLVQLPVSPIRYWTATGCVAVEPVSMSRSRVEKTIFCRAVASR